MADSLAAGRTSPCRQRPRFFAGGVGGAGFSGGGIKAAWGAGAGVSTALRVGAGRSRASMAVPSRLICPISSSPRCSLMSASCTRSTRRASANSSKAREKVASEGNFLHSRKPQMRRSARSMARRSIRPAVVVSPSTALATKAFASQARSQGGRPMPAQVDTVNSSMRTHSRVWITFSSFGVSVPTSFFNSGSNSC